MIIKNKKNCDIFNLIDRFLNLNIILNINNNIYIYRYIYLIKFLYLYNNNKLFIINNFKKNKNKFNKTFISYILSYKIKNNNLILEGVEYKINYKNNNFIFYLGYSHLILFKNNYNLKYNGKYLEFNKSILDYNYLNNIKFQIFKLKILNKFKNKGFNLYKNDKKI